MGTLVSFIKEGWPPKSHFTVDDIPDLTGRVMIVTGGNSGVGKETVKALLAHNATVYLAARNRDKAEAAIKELKEQTGKEAVFLQLDLSSLKDVKRAAEEFLSKENRLDVLFNNAGVLYPPHSELTADGYDMQFGVHVLGHFYLTQLLLPTLLSTAKNHSPDGKARVITTSSIGHRMFPGVKIETLSPGAERDKVTTENLYCQSKIGSVMFARELGKRYGDQGIVSTSLNPGNLRTDLQRNLVGLQKKFLHWICHPAPLGALTQLWAGTSPETKDLNGAYLIPWARVGKASAPCYDDKASQGVWEWCEEAVKKSGL